MTFVSKLAMAAVLTLGTSAMGAAPAAAQDKKAQAGAMELKVSKEFRTPAAAADVALKAQNYAAAEPNVVAAEAVAKNEDEKYYAAGLRLKLEQGRNARAGIMTALRALVASPRTPAGDLPAYNSALNYMMGQDAMGAKKPADAITYLQKAREAGSTEPDLPVLLANAYAATGNQAQAVVEVDRAIQASKAAGRKPPEDWYKFAIPRVNAGGDRAAMATWLTRYIQEYPTVKNWRWAVTVFSQGVTDQRTERLALYRLLRTTNALADRGDYANYAFTAQQAGLPWEAVAVIEEGRKGGKLPQTDADVQRTLTAAQTQSKAEGSLEGLAKQAAAASTGASASQTADAFLASGNNARALELYDLALTKGGVNADQVNLNRGIALQRLGRKDEARTAFQQVKGAPLNNIALLWAASVDFPPLAA